MMLRGKHVVEQVEKARQRSVKNPLSMQQSYMEQISKAFRKLDAEPAVVDCQSFIEVTTISKCFFVKSSQ